jgi:hypothetical protein
MMTLTLQSCWACLKGHAQKHMTLYIVIGGEDLTPRSNPNYLLYLDFCPQFDGLGLNHVPLRDPLPQGLVQVIIN